MHCSLPELWAMPLEYYEALVGWVREKAEEAERDGSL